MKKYLALFFLFALIWSCDDDDSDFLEACFTYQFSDTTEGQIHFTNCSENASTYLWEFGDGETSTEKNPVHTFSSSSPYFVKLTAQKGHLKDTFSATIGLAIVHKPNIYIYPTEQTDLCVKIEFPLGGEVIESIPEYGGEWCVNVLPSGLIDNQYTFLFYESSQPDIFQDKEGWCIPRNELESFFENNLQQYNFSPQEITDFTDYWVPRLNTNSFYLIHPQTNEIIDKAIQLNFSTQPDNMGRLFYLITGANKAKTLKEPEIKPLVRNDFYVTEWGVILE